MEYNINFESYDNGRHTTNDVFVAKPFENMEISYDGGRFSIYINGEQHYYTSLAGNDFSVTIEKIK